MRRAFITVGGITLHTRECHRESSTGPALVLLHPSPMSSAMFAPLMAQFPVHQHVIAIDTPGYGLSEPLPAPATTIADYLPTLDACFTALAGERFMLYGSATGAQLALGYANRHPGRVAHLLLDNAAHFDDAERDAILERYFIDITPRADGQHLSALWQMCAQMLVYFPWYEANDVHRFRQTDPSPAEIQALMQHFLAAGPRYTEAYRAAFKHERAPHYQSLTVPTTILRWLASPLLPQIDHLLRFPLPKCVRSVETPADMSRRYAALIEQVALARAGTS